MATSVLHWLDFSESEQRKARDILQLFTQKESRDELGIGVIRDVISDALFPGVSVVQTRARYFVFVPWLYLEAERRGKRGHAQTEWVEWRERGLIETLRRGGDESGLIGRIAGQAVKLLPSTIYWNALESYGIRKTAGAKADVAALNTVASRVDEVQTERVERQAATWPSDMPRAPKGFPDQLESLDFTLTTEEADWLRERIVSSCGDTFLGWLMAERKTPELESNGGAWAEPWVPEAPEKHRRVLQHAKLFSLVMVGAALLYNQLLAERARKIGLSSDDAQIEDYRSRLAEWRENVAEHRPELLAWDVTGFWTYVESRYGKQLGLTKHFVNSWLGRVLRPDLEAATSDDGARDLIAKREQQQKRGQARLVNDKLLKNWGGDAGTWRLDFRWGQVRDMLADINGEANADAGA